MSLLSWIFGQPKRPEQIALATLPAEDDPELLEIDPALEAPVTVEDLLSARAAAEVHRNRALAARNRALDSGELENVFCEIRYRDASGHVSKRAITVLQIHEGTETSMLFARCHLRNAQRNFRVDRILEVITVDGEIVDPETFFREVLAYERRERLQAAISVSDVTMTPETVATSTHQAVRALGFPAARAVRNALLSPLTVLVACAKSDGDFHVEELDRIMDFAENEAMHLCDTGALDCDLTIEMADALGKAIAIMRPQTRTIERHMLAVLCAPEAQRRRFKRALAAVAIADGIFHEHEREFLEEFDALAGLAEGDPASLVEQLNAAAAVAEGL